MALTSRKLQLIYFPIILHAVLFIVLYTFCNWLFLVKLNVFPIKEDIINVFLPLILPWIQILIWIRPRIRLLILNGGNDRLPSLYYLAVAFAMAVPTIVAHNYM